jgi:hypothetical protein
MASYHDISSFRAWCRRATRRRMTLAAATLAAFSLTSAMLTPSHASTSQPYSNSFWARPVPQGVAPVAGSAEKVQYSLGSGYTTGGWYFDNTTTWGIPVVYSRNTDPVRRVEATRYDVRTVGWFNIPDGAKRATSRDGHLVVKNLDTGEELDIWRMEGLSVEPGQSVVYTSGAYITRWDDRATGLSDYRPGGNGAVASGFAAAGGLVHPAEMKAAIAARTGVPHALAVVTASSRTAVGYVAPATHADGKCVDVRCIQEGSRFRLDPTFDVEATALPDWKKVLLRTLQTHGAYVADQGSNLAVRGYAPVNDTVNPWTAMGIGMGASIADLPWNRMQLLPPPTTVPAPQGVSGTAAPGSVTISWEAQPEDAGVVRYEVWRGNSSWSAWVRIGTVAGGTLSFIDRSTQSGTTYTYGIRAWDAAGNQSASSVAIRVLAE